MTGPHTLGIAMQLPGVLLTLTSALDRHDNNPARAALDNGATEDWSDAEPETRAGILLSAAWGAGRGPSPVAPDGMPDAVDDYVADFHAYAAAQTADQSEAFHGRAFPAMPLPGQAGALASSLGFDRDDLYISLGVALVLLAAARRVDQ
jgi:hypothetical protein